MLIGQTIAAEDGAPTSVWTHWSTRLGANVTSVLDVIYLSSDAQIALELYEKDESETTETGLANGSGTTVTTAGVTDFRTTTVKQLVRYKVTLQRTSGTGVVYAHFRIPNPSWEDNGAQDI